MKSTALSKRKVAEDFDYDCGTKPVKKGKTSTKQQKGSKKKSLSKIMSLPLDILALVRLV